MGFHKTKRPLLGPGYKDIINANHPDPNTLLAVTLAITSANIKAMYTTPVAVIAAPGTGLIVVPELVVVNFTGTATQYLLGGVVNLVYHGGSTAANTGSVPASVIQSASSSITTLGPPAAANGTTVVSNTGIDITNATQAFTTGTGTILLKVFYRIIQL